LCESKEMAQELEIRVALLEKKVLDEPPRMPLKLELHKPLTADGHTQEKLTESTGLELKSFEVNRRRGNFGHDCVRRGV